MKKRAIFAIHGFSGHPEEMRYLGERLADSLRADLFLPIIPGHARQPADLAQTTRQDWYQGIKASFDQIVGQYQEVVVIGNSFGANLALKLARHRSVAAAVGVAIPYLRWYQRLALETLIYLNKPFRTYWVKPKTGPRATEQIPGYTQRCYEEIALSAMEQLLAFDREEMGESVSKHTDTPTLLISARGDPFVPPEGVAIYQERLGPKAEILRWDDPYHLIVQGERKAELAQTISRWLQEKL
jgi:carboxylesterase